MAYSRATRTGALLTEQIAHFETLYRDDPQALARLFIDDLHLTDAGHRILAERMLATLRRQGVGAFGTHDGLDGG